MAPRFASVDDYIASYPEETRTQLARVRTAIRTAVPDAREKISYGMATFILEGKPLLYFAGWKNHVGVYPVPTGDAAFEEAIRPFRRAKDTVRQFFGDWELLEPGLVPVSAWRPDGSVADPQAAYYWSGVARKP